MNMTCEEYVINKLMAVEKDNDILQENLRATVKQLNDSEERYNKLSDILERNLKLSKVESGTEYVDMTVWARSWNPEELQDFVTLKSLLNIKSEIIEETEDEEDGVKE